MVSSELRRDPVTGRSVLIDISSHPHPADFELEPVRLDDGAPSCPFCEGREADAGPELLAWRDGGAPNAPGWSVRVVPNRRPMLRIEGGQGGQVNGVFEWRDGLGAHEAVIESPLHAQRLQDLPPDRLWRVLWAWRTRLQDLKRDTRFAAAVVFKNHGRAAGARMDHSHSQVCAYPIVPPALDDEVRGAADYLARTGRCIFCDIAAQELRDGQRIVCDTTSIIAITPFASRVPFETWVLPREHAARFEDVTDAELTAMAEVFRDVMTRIDWALERPAYNLVLHTAPFGGEAGEGFHWHLEIIPRVTRWSGLEWGSGIPRNPVSPEEAARVLREVRP